VVTIPNCCAMPLDKPVGASYVCLTCGTTYRHLIGGWTLAGPIVDLAPELQAPDPIDQPFTTPGYDGPEGTEWPRHRYEDTLDTTERTGN